MYAAEFHKVFHPTENVRPKALDLREASDRAGFKLEELVEFLYASAQGEMKTFDELVSQMHKDIDRAVEKTKNTHQNQEDYQGAENQLVHQADALLDLLYFTYGSFVLMGVDPRPLHKIVHQANMGKIFPDGQVHYHPETGKVLKPENWEKDYGPEEKLRDILRQQNDIPH
ncbi:hypothetical protein CBF29_08980 [Vagococcus elongatus]|uniref:HAD family hydrolase n=2 Tax=Vagococcus elongatus TaxID=180344 RepID=A0A430ARU6_9ENTE|nr:hypothetical protein CBF29_08980 [Vagococcus elongatus]